MNYTRREEQQFFGRFESCGLVFVDHDGNRTTFGTWSKGSGKNQGTEFRINEEIEMEFKATASKRVMIDYSELRRIIEYNTAPIGNPGWSPIHNCSYYAAAVWGNVTGTPIDMRLYTPSNLEEWIKTH